MAVSNEKQTLNHSCHVQLCPGETGRRGHGQIFWIPEAFTDKRKIFHQASYHLDEILTKGATCFCFNSILCIFYTEQLLSAKHYISAGYIMMVRTGDRVTPHAACSLAGKSISTGVGGQAKGAWSPSFLPLFPTPNWWSEGRTLG